MNNVRECSKNFLKIKTFAQSIGVLDAGRNGMQLTDDLFLRLVSSENHEVLITYRQDDVYPIEAAFFHDEMRYFTILSEVEYQENIEILGGLDIERVTTA